jgi:hypothetical protein
LHPAKCRLGSDKKNNLARARNSQNLQLFALTVKSLHLTVFVVTNGVFEKRLYEIRDIVLTNEEFIHRDPSDILPWLRAHTVYFKSLKLTKLGIDVTMSKGSLTGIITAMTAIAEHLEVFFARDPCQRVPPPPLPR